MTDKPEPIEKGYSPEFLMQIIEQAKQHLPGWMYAALVQGARPIAGGHAAHRVDEPDLLHKMALAEIKPETLRAMSNDDLATLWQRLGQWFVNAQRRKQAVENFINAGVWVKSEMTTRDLEIKPSAFVEAIAALEGLSANSVEKNTTIEKEVLPCFGASGARVCFVMASPSSIEIVRKEMLVGRPGEIFNERYLAPLGLRRDEVSMCALVPELLLDDSGRRRDPTESEFANWAERTTKTLDELQPMHVIALGMAAGKALGERAELTLPHPAVLCSKKDSGEVTRKLKRLRPKLEKELMLKAEEGGTRSNNATQNWVEHWQDMLPKSGKGRFVYQHHWRGLSADESKLDEQALFSVGEHSLHGDLRLEGNDDALWGVTVFLGEIKNNQGDNHDRLIDWNKSVNIEISPKLVQPKEWLDVGVKAPLVQGPGAAGATTNTYAKFFVEDKGTYELGVAREHSVEIFLDGGKLKGRYLLLYAPVGGRRLWLIDKPEDQTPTAEKGDLAETLSALRRKKQRFLMWGKPGERPRLIDVKSGREQTVKIVKADPVKKIVYGIVLDPYGADGPRADAHNDWVPPADVEKTAHTWLRESRVIGLQHSGKANAQVVESWVEPYPAKQYTRAMRNLDHSVYCRKFGNDVLHSGAWVLGVQLGDKEWTLFEQGKLNAFSPGGYGARIPLNKDDMPKVTYIDLVEAAHG
jgi:uracil-DNA glycosylase